MACRHCMPRMNQADLRHLRHVGHIGEVNTTPGHGRIDIGGSSDVNNSSQFKPGAKAAEGHEPMKHPVKGKNIALAHFRGVLRKGIDHPDDAKNLASILLAKMRNPDDPDQMAAAKMAVEYAFGKPGSMDEEEIKRRAEVRALEIVELRLREARARAAIEMTPVAPAQIQGMQDGSVQVSDVFDSHRMLQGCAVGGGATGNGG